MKELDDISQEIAQLQRYMRAAPSQIPNLTQTLPQAAIGSIIETLETPENLTITSLFNKNERTDFPEFLKWLNELESLSP